ncbi:CJH_07325 family protein [Helicobacter sp. MIT 05-5293]|uniref:CJH_07325 family protein n=1 Tax=Helicobacter sp. MIT 05-5293 TaxID=1548149 RepID=UPI00051E007E|nr:CJH_07325 family protein [Helicobacter sp. MIT 05-5293]TLD80190.1 CJH_07325 family protein [Helicobacter sp. MIT 05-5293]
MKNSKRLLRASFGKVGYINISALNTGSISKNVYGEKNPSGLKEAIIKANKTLDRLYEKYERR